MSDETWRPIPEEDYVDLYEVSDLGRIRSVTREVRFGNNMRTVEGRILRPRKVGTCTEYQSVMLSNGSLRKQVLMHRMMLIAFTGPPPEGMEARHLNGDAFDNRLENLEWNTHLINMRDQDLHKTRARGKRHGRHTCPESTLRGSQQPTSKLKEAQVVDIRERLGTITQRALAKEYGVSESLISAIKQGRSWAHTKKESAR